MSSRFWSLERSLLALFVASGFAGLIYQSIWSHYLGLTLGHAAYAQTLVLAIFMGGMALGAWLVSRRGRRWKQLILAYAIVEIVIGVAGLAFHPIFEAYSALSLDVVYPTLDSPTAVRAWQWGSAALLIAPQSVLLGMTFPLMSGGYLRIAPRADGEILGGLYFTNSIGAAAGALFATFVLLPWVGMPGAVAVAGGVNLLVGALAWVVARQAVVPAEPAAAVAAEPAPRGETPAATPVGAGFYRMMLLAAAITGASSFVYEIGWVRMLNQALGTTVHSFELMLAAFILGLAFGGLWIRKRSARIGDAVAYAGYAQVWMGVAALVSIPVFSQSFHWVGFLIQNLERDATGYSLFSLGSGVIALLVMFPAAFFAGMTLPLFTMTLLRRGAGESSIGRIYAANTLGAIVGVALAVHVLIPLMGLRLAVTLAALADIALGLVLLRRFADRVNPPVYLGALATTLVVLAFSLLAGRTSPEALASGVFRTGRTDLPGESTVHFLRDGKTATVAVYTQGTSGTIATNGKPDASLELDPKGQVSDDEITMLMAGALPLAAHPKPERIAVIGWGSGLTTHTLLGSSAPKVVDSIEIERAMYDGAKLFGPRVERGYSDPRSRVHIDDARTYFSSGKRTYDVIVSEPSNPWVSGVASLFTREFYSFLRGHLTEGGIVIQWVQSYELDDPLLLTMVAALIAEFPHVEVYLTNSADLLFIASESPVPPLDMRRLQAPVLRAELASVGLSSMSDFQVRRVSSRKTLEALALLFDVKPYSDFHPVVALEAPRARFTGAVADSLQWLLEVGMPVLELTDNRRPPRISENQVESLTSTASTTHWLGRDVRESVRDGSPGPLKARDAALLAKAEALRSLSAKPVSPEDLDAWLTAVQSIAENSISQLHPDDHMGLWIQPSWIDGSEQPLEVQRVLAAYDAAARRDVLAMRQAGEAALEVLGPERPDGVREHMLVIAELGALAAGDHQAVFALERGIGRDVVVGSRYGFVRSFLLASADLIDGEE
jgi:spermidine synthase